VSYLNAVCCLSTDTQNTLKYHLVTVKPFFAAHIFDTATDTATDMVIVEHVDAIPNLSIFLPIGPV